MKSLKTFNDKGDCDVKKSFARCLRKRCSYLSDGYLSICSFPVLVKWFDKKFNKSITETLINTKIDIHDNDTDGFKIKKQLLKPINACKYCAEPEWFDWSRGTSEPKTEDYCVSGSFEEKGTN